MTLSPSRSFAGRLKATSQRDTATRSISEQPRLGDLDSLPERDGGNHIAIGVAHLDPVAGVETSAQHVLRRDLTGFRYSLGSHGLKVGAIAPLFVGDLKAVTQIEEILGHVAVSHQ